VMYFGLHISNLSFPWINPHNSHHTTTMQTHYQWSYKWILFCAWIIKLRDNLMLKQLLGSKILIMSIITWLWHLLYISRTWTNFISTSICMVLFRLTCFDTKKRGLT
jgi:hypothetical protein